MKTTFDEIAKTYLPEVESYIDQLFEKRITLQNNFCSIMSRYHFSTGGKRIRALIPLLIFDAFKADPKLAIPLGATVEMIHNATLVHDDLQDGDQVRRGKPTIWKQYSPAQAINCGDAMFFYALELFGKMDIPQQVRGRVYDLIVQATLGVIEGQAQEFLMKEESYPSVSRYLQIIRGKTSCLFSLPIVGALEVLGCERPLIEATSGLAEDLGVVFQIQDDLLDIYGEKQRDQKATDIAEGKVSFLVAFVNDNGSPDDRAALDRILKLPREQTSRREIDHAIEIFDRYNARGAALEFISETTKRLSDSRELKQHPALQEALVELSDLFLRPIFPK